jgi:exodeoxyribonuclease III
MSKTRAPSKGITLVSWNVNGMRSVQEKGFATFLAERQPDILCLQETKVQPESCREAFPPEYHVHWNPARQRGYSGTLIASRIKPLDVRFGMGIGKHDEEGRMVTAEFPDFHLVCVYAPNSQRELVRLPYRTQEWEKDFLAYLLFLRKTKPVIFCGDLNVSHQEIDLANPQSNRRNAGFTDEERGCFSAILEAGFIDSFRELHPGETGRYSWWTYRFQARERNIGWRLDYVVMSRELRGRLADAFIWPEVAGSDHCPVGVVLTP